MRGDIEVPGFVEAPASGTAATTPRVDSSPRRCDERAAPAFHRRDRFSLRLRRLALRHARLLSCITSLLALALVAGPARPEAGPSVVPRGPGAATPANPADAPGLPTRSASAVATPQDARQPLASRAAALTPMTNRAFTYQGLLRASGAPVNGLTDLRFTIFDALTGGNAFGPAQVVTLGVSNGLVTTLLNDAGQFPDSVFDGRAAWIQIEVRNPSGVGGFTALSPRQPLVAAPVAATLTPHAVMRAGDTYNGWPAVTIDARPELYGNPEALRALAAPSNAWLSFAPSALWADSDHGNGVVGVTRTGTGVFGGAADTAGWAGYFSGNVRVTGKLAVDRLHSLIAINSVGPLPRSSAAFTTYGGTLRIQYSGSGYSATANTLIGMTVKLDGTAFDQTGIFANQAGMHLAFVSKEWVLTGIPAGTHTISLEAMSGTFTDSGDIFNATVTELPY